jgi:hypothetical protein
MSFQNHFQNSYFSKKKDKKPSLTLTPNLAALDEKKQSRHLEKYILLLYGPYLGSGLPRLWLPSALVSKFFTK